MKAERAYPRFSITAKGTRWVEGGHPWIYAQEIVSAPEGVENGALVDAVSEKGKYLGSGFFSRESKIRIRLLSRNANDRFDADFWRRRIRYAWDYRKTVMGADVSCCRVIFGEADGFPGLTVDRFENLLVTQTLSVGMERIKEMLFPLLVEVLAEDGVVTDGVFERNDAAIRALEGMEQGKGWFPLEGRDVPASAVTEICENGVYYRVDVENGQKTGFSSTRSITASRSRALPAAAACSTASPTPAPLRSTPRGAARSTSPPWTSRRAPSTWPARTPCATGWRAAWTS